ncbi:DUF6894 family protein [Bradyrhizobium sp. ORS 111]|uniref:DUF6894 family protein n=1 Tax=Bradyrhizobium sp. ORS 111 TaxID=1685958 RepID=UPI00388DB093
MSPFHFHIVSDDGVVGSTGQPVADRDQALAVAKRLAIDLAEERKEFLGGGYFVSVTDDNEREIHRESIDSAEKSG